MVKEKYCPRCAAFHAISAFDVVKRDGNGNPVKYSSYCSEHERERKRDYARRKAFARTAERRALAETTPKLDAATLALVQTDPIWQLWLACPPRTELELQHMYAVELQRKYKVDYKRLSHSMRACWCDEWERRLGHAPYAWQEAG